MTSNKGRSGEQAPSTKTGNSIGLLTLSLLSGLTVYLAYHPSDSISVERGDAVWFCMLALGLFAIATMSRVISRRQPQGTDLQLTDSDSSTPLSGIAEESTSERPQSQSVHHLPSGKYFCLERWLLWSPWCIAIWMMIAAFSTSPPGNLRQSTNEAWLWAAAACVFQVARTQLGRLESRRAILSVMLVIASGLAVHGLHQYLISLPQNRAEYLADPESVLQIAGIDAPVGSSERMIFENRLMDGGPSGTFALANTLAGYLLVAAVVGICFLMSQWKDLSKTQRATLATFTLLCVSSLLATRSRTATLALLISIGLVLCAQIGLVRRRRKVLLRGLTGLVILGFLFVGYLSRFGNREWFEQAPASLAFRFQYWRSTWNLAVNSPWFGAGPGNFQATYGLYREASASEQIAEPHHFLMETLASGGFPAVMMLFVLGFLVVLQQLRIRDAERLIEHTDSNPSTSGRKPTRLHQQAIWAGAITGLALVWVTGLIQLELPDVMASLFAIPICIVMGKLLNPTLSVIHSRTLDLSVGIGLIALMIHLSVSGGWTVPGLAIWAWVGFGLLSRCTQTNPLPHARERETHRCDSSPSRSQTIISTLKHSWPLPLILSYWWMTFEPMRQHRQALEQITRAQQSSDNRELEKALNVAARTDPWSPEAYLWLSDFHHWQVIHQEGNEPSKIYGQWRDTLSKIRERSNLDPTTERMIGTQAIHLYQRWGRKEDLELAKIAFERGSQRSPSDEWLRAQLALISAENIEWEKANKTAAIAVELSQSGNNIERSLTRQMVYTPTHIGETARGGPVRKDAATLLQVRLALEP